MEAQNLSVIFSKNNFFMKLKNKCLGVSNNYSIVSLHGYLYVSVHNIKTLSYEKTEFYQLLVDI